MNVHSSALLLVLVVISLVKNGLAMAGFLFGAPALAPPAGPGPPPFVSLLTTLVFAAVGVFLVGGGRRDSRAVVLGTTFVVLSTSFGNRLVEHLAPVLDGTSRSLVRVSAGVNVEAFLPWLAWWFVQEFPSGPTPLRARLALRVGGAATFALGCVLLTANTLLTLEAVTGTSVPLLGFAARAFASTPGAVLAPGTRVLSRTTYYPLLLALTVCALPFALVRARAAEPHERRRVLWFLSTLLVAALVGGFEVIRSSAQDATGVAGILHQLLILAALWSAPFVTAYVVLVHRLLDARFVVRMALQYAFARYSVLAVTALPFIALGLHLYRHRADTLVAVASRSQPLWLVACIVAGAVALVFRRRILHAIDRRFFRDQWDAREILTALVERSRGVNSVAELGRLIAAETDRALHVRSVAILFRDPFGRSFSAAGGMASSLPATSLIVQLLGASGDPLNVDEGLPVSVFERLASDDRSWVLSNGFSLLVPMLGRDGVLAGILALGERRSERPFTREDRRMLQAVAAAGTVALENLVLRSTAGRGHTITSASTPPDPEAFECLACGTIFGAGAAACVCGAALKAAQVPLVVAQKFRVERRLGAGGMGIVYLATDLTLRRRVAIKTLPRMSPDAAALLRREARAMARVPHANLAAIHGTESWRGMPLLVFEYLESGTLADRLRHRVLSPSEAVTLGTLLSGALETAHAHGVLHGDIKPSNIGYTADGSPKLLDFGVARLLRTSASTAADADTTPTGESSSGWASQVEISTLGGTLAYLAPEALDGAPPNPLFDLWSLSVVLYEALTGVNPFVSATALDTMIRIQQADPPFASELRAECPPAIARFLRESLQRECDRRPQSALDYRHMLQQSAASALG
jgi:hypothetical protein